MTITVLGATGNVGQPLVEQLAKGGHAVRAVTRSADKPLPKGVERASPSNLDEALKGATKLFLLTPPGSGYELEDAALAAAKAAGVKHVVRLSSIGASGDKPLGLGAMHLKRDEALKASGLEWTLVRPGFFMSNVLAWLPQIRESGAVRNNYGDGPMYPIAPDDIAGVAVVALTGQGHAGKAYDLTGDVAISAVQQIATMGSVLGRPIGVVDLLPDAAEQEAIARGIPAPMAAGLKALWVSVRAGKGAMHTDTARTLLGRPLMTFAEWCRLRLPKP
jgi:uncharacterized protein YbjT (DUF2867 family)